MSEPSQEYASSGSEVAIIGMAGRFPGAASVREFWDNLCRGVESLSLLSDDDLARAGIDPALRAHPGYVRAVPAIDDVEMFDAGFFGYTRLEAEVMDPQQRLFLEAAWQALEEAGYDPALYPHPVGVFTGAKTNTYLLNLVADRERRQRLDTLQLALGNDLACMATRVSYKLDLRGPSYALHTACSTSLVAIHLACQSLLMDECRMAVAGGAAVNVPQRKGYLYQPGGILSPDGSCRTFDARAQGSNFGNGVGAVVLKRLEEALADGDHVYAVIKGSAANNDGARKASYTAPGVEGQTAVILEALAAAGVDADTVSYVEAHGTATDLGDSIEVLALTEAYRASTERVGYCGIGSVKTNVGHLETAAGIAGLIKTALALEREHLPASLHFEQPNPKIDFASSPFHVVGEAREWRRQEGAPRRAGLSSFGIGSTNVHMILEEAPRREPTSPSRPWQLLLLSARSEAALEAATCNLAEHLEAHPGLKLADAAFTLQAGRRLFPYRRAVVCRESDGAAGAAAALRALDPEQAFSHLEEGPGRSVAFLFPGLGDQSLRMGLGLYRSEPTFRRHVDRCCDLLAPHLGVDLREILYPEGTEGGGEEATGNGIDLRRMLGRSAAPGAPEADDPAVRRLQETAFSQPAVFVFEYALARLWIEWGVKPQAMIGYSLGEYVAAALGGVFPLEKALELVAKRARLIQELPPGAMLAVPFSAEEAREHLGEEVALAAINGPRQCVLSGTPEAIVALERRLTGEGVACRRLATTHAFHSPMMRPAYEAVVELMRGVRLQAPRVPFLSNVTGTWIRPEEATDPEYWARHMVQAVRFGDGVAELLREPGRVLLEVGPGQTLSSFVKLHPDCTDEAARFVFASLPPAFGRQPDAAWLIGTLGKLRLAGAAVDWKGFYRGETRRRVPLPTYPFERQRYWLDGEETAPAASLEPGLQKNPDLAQWFYQPVWGRAERPAGEPVSGLWLLLCDGHGLGEDLARRLEAAGREVVRARIGEGYRRLSLGEYEVRPGLREDFDALFSDLKQRGRKPAAIVHLWGYGAPDDLDSSLDRCFYSLLFLAQSLGRQGWTDPLRLEVVTSGLQAVAAGDVPRPETATVLGPAKVIPQEYAHVACRVIDLAASSKGDEDLAGRLFAELGAAGPETAIALRGDDRWTEGYEAVRLESPEPASLPWREGGVYLITGGLGGVGFVMAEHLARTVRARMVLTRRSALSDEAIQKVRRLEELGAEVLVLAADTTDAERMRAVVAEALEKFGALHGVLHAAGLGGGGLIQLKTRAAAAAVLAPKVHGLRVVEEAVASNDVDLELLVLFSSLQTALGDFGQVDYCAANAYLDAVAQRNAVSGGPRTAAVGWDNWQEVGIAVTAEVPEHMRAWREEILAKGILPSEGPEVLDRALAAGLPRLVVTTQDLAARIEQSHSYSGDKVMQQLQGGAAASATARPAPVLGGAHRPARGELERRVTAIWQRMLGRERIGVNDNFFDLGGNSLLGMQLITELNRELDAQIAPVALFEAPTVSSLVKYLSPGPETGETEPAAAEKAERPSFFTAGSRDIAVIGMDGRFPKAKGLEEFWRNLREGVDCVTVFSDEELVAAGVDPATLREPTYVKARPVLDDVEYFDATLFGYSPREAEIIDPQHRVFLQCAWTALERAGYDPERYPGAVGVFAGAAISTYLLNLYSNPELIGAVGNFQAMIGNEKDSLATRVSYKLNLRGPSLSVQTFCSTSLVAVHLACQSLLTGECDMALAGGASIHVPQQSGYHYQEGGFVSRDGRVKAFDAKADGFLFGNGVGVVLLKRLEDALADGDRVLAVIKGSAINNDGSAKVGYTATSVEGQSEVIARAMRNAGVEAESIGYIESHGTGTALGDPVEIAALTKAFHSPSRGTCPIGSVKTNIGHLDRAAGVSSLIKAVMVLEHGEIPPSLHFEEPNPKIDFANSPFYVNTRLTEWKTNGHPRRVGVNSLGLGGTNAHVVLEEAPVAGIEPSGPSRPRQLLVLSARSREALEAMTNNLAAHLRRHPEENLADAAYTLQIGRKVLEHRRVLVAAADGIEGAAAALEARDPKRVLTSFNEEGERPVVFLFPGLGGQYPGMAEGLYRSEPVFREEVDRCAEILRPVLGLDLREVIYPADRKEEAGAAGIDLRRMLAKETEDEATRRLNRTAFSQPAMFVVEYALARLWLSWGLRPEAMIGYSIGEYVAACLAGVLTLEDALTLVARRAQRIEELPAGAMLAVPLTPEALEPLLGEGLSLAAVNGPEQSVVAGPPEAVEALERELDGRGLSYRRLQAAHAFHSALLEPLSEPLAELVRTFTLSPPALPYLSNVTGTWITPEEATDPTYWARHMCGTVRFAEGIEELLRQPRRILLEVGPGQTLSSLVLQNPASAAENPGDRPEVLASVRHSYEREDDQAYLLGALGKAWMAGAWIDWASFCAGERRLRVPLPTYPFERQRYWVEPQQEASRSALSRHVLGGAAPAVKESGGLSSPSWKRSLPRALSARDLAAPRRWLVLADGSGLSRGLVEKLRGAGHEVVTATPGLDFRHDGNAFTVRPSSAADWGSLLAALPKIPEKVLHLWGLAADPGFAEAQELGLGALRGLSQALEGALSLASGEEAPEICVVLSGTQEVTGEEALRPDGATALAGCWLLPVRCRALDVVPPAGDAIPERLVDQVLAEALGEATERLVSYRGGHRWMPSLEPVQEETEERRPSGTYLITGGLSPAGFFLARALAAEGVRLALIEPPGQAPEAAASRVEELRRAGAEVWSTEADLADPETARQAIAAARERFGKFDGVLHAAWPEGEDGAFPSARWLLALDEAARDLSPAAALVVSPLTPLSGLAEAAEAVFLESFALSGRGALPWVSVVWDTRQELAPEELSRVLGRLLATSGVRQVVVAGRPLATRWEALTPAAEAPAPRPAGALASYSRPHLKVDYLAPRDETEQVIAGIWADLLGVGQVGVHDPFLDLGGDSLLATRLVARMRDAFGLELPVRLIFEAATVAEQAATLEGLRAEQEEGEMAELLALLDGLSEEEAAVELERRKSLINAGG